MASILKVDTIQDQSGNNIINENADTITIGASGDTINVVGTLQNNGAAVGGTMTPAFEGYLGTDGGQTVANATWTTVAIETEIYDTNGCYNNTGSTVTLNGISVPAYTFLPNVAGKYLVYGSVLSDTGTDSNINYVGAALYKENGNIISQTRNSFEANPVRQGYVTIQAVLDMNGTTNSVQLRGRISAANGSGMLFEGYPQWRRATYFGAYKIIE